MKTYFSRIFFLRANSDVYREINTSANLPQAYEIKINLFTIKKWIFKPFK